MRVGFCFSRCKILSATNMAGKTCLSSLCLLNYKNSLTHRHRQYWRRWRKRCRLSLKPLKYNIWWKYRKLRRRRHPAPRLPLSLVSSTLISTYWTSEQRLFLFIQWLFQGETKPLSYDFDYKMAFFKNYSILLLVCGSLAFATW